MAIVDNAAITAALATIFNDAITWNINRAIVLAQLLPTVPGNGKNLSWVGRFGVAAPATAPIADGATVSVLNSDAKVAATLNYGIYHDAFSTTGFAAASAAASGNPAELSDLFAEEIMESTTRLAMAVANDIYVGTGAGVNMNGLLSASGAAPGIGATGTYAGINRGTQTQWAATVMANGGAPRPLSLALMREMRRRIYIASGMKPDLIVCDPVTHEKYANLFGPERRYNQDVTLRGQTIKLDGGMQALEFDGIPVVEDVSHPAGKMTFLNTREVALRFLPDAARVAAQSRGSVALSGTPEEQFGFGGTKMSARIQPLAVVGDAFPFALYIYPQVQVRRCNAHGVINDLETT